MRKAKLWALSGKTAQIVGFLGLSLWSTTALADEGRSEAVRFLNAGSHDLIMNEDTFDQLIKVNQALLRMDGAGLYNAISDKEQVTRSLAYCLGRKHERLVVLRDLDPTQQGPRSSVCSPSGEFGEQSMLVRASKRTDELYEARVNMRMASGATGAGVRDGVMNLIDGSFRARASGTLAQWIQSERRRWPATSAFGDSYFPVTITDVPSIGGIRQRVHIDPKRFGERYPVLAGVMTKIQGGLMIKGRLETASGKQVGWIEFDGDRKIFDQVTTDPRALAYEDWHLVADVQMIVDGIIVRVDSLRARVKYTENGIELRQQRMPDQIEITGYAMGVFPVWLVDALIPSSIGELANQFIGAIITGPTGHGSHMAVAADERHARAEIHALFASNEMVRLGMKIQSLLGLGDGKMMKELGKLRQDLMATAASDLRQRQQPRVSIAH